MKRVELVQLGIGHVGRAVAQIVLEERKRWRERYGLDISYRAVADTSGALAGEDLLPQAIRLKEAGGRLSELGAEPLEEVLAEGPGPKTARVLVDAAAGEGTYDLDVRGVRRGSSLVLCNKGPISGSTERYEGLVGEGPERLRYEATVGAGVPVLSTIEALQASGDDILEIQASPSGTLGFIMSGVEEGRPFSEVVREAAELHYTEPDPRDDLSGLDVARKALILARKIGRRLEPEEVPYESLVPEELREVSVEEFMERLSEFDEGFAARLSAVRPGHVLRYLARIPKEGPVEVGLREVPAAGCFGARSGVENVFNFRTRRYSDVTLTVSGPGAGPERTASGVVCDLLDLARRAAESDGGW
ncbi:homoserine dehydrogenase [Rubrobacter xylanophilus DSM 9941]|uniref:Homoserine dehydrogenase n=1 Tax=Rubrobacter xylanophilus (strain DSM 9941 / JCM 11954 / NBRC 16129 / PRD-1) TaxID=266117 RepID=Q1AX21_RUBXD|nr:homoserine dehydrogenase [Rubrobacter xylanophilus]ABG04057.1 homoserine dehydrogenase [Rubrobacter xylanophilus DSM 9941]